MQVKRANDTETGVTGSYTEIYGVPYFLGNLEN